MAIFSELKIADFPGLCVASLSAISFEILRRAAYISKVSVFSILPFFYTNISVISTRLDKLTEMLEMLSEMSEILTENLKNRRYRNCG